MYFHFTIFFMHIIYWFHDFLKINKQIENEKDPYSPSHPRRSKRRNISRNNSKYNDEEPLQPISRMRRRNMADQQVRILISRIFLEFFFFKFWFHEFFLFTWTANVRSTYNGSTQCSIYAKNYSCGEIS